MELTLTLIMILHGAIPDLPPALACSPVISVYPLSPIAHAGWVGYVHRPHVRAPSRSAMFMPDAGRVGYVHRADVPSGWDRPLEDWRLHGHWWQHQASYHPSRGRWPFRALRGPVPNLTLAHKYPLASPVQLLALMTSFFLHPLLL